MTRKQRKAKPVRRANTVSSNRPREHVPKVTIAVNTQRSSLGKRKRHPLGANAFISEWVDRLLAPSHLSAVPRPRPFSDTRVAVATQRTFFTIIQGGSVANVTGVQAATPYNISSNFINTPVTNADTMIGGLTSGSAPSIMTIPSGSIFDCNLQSVSMRVKCLQPPLTAQGSVLVGLVPTNALAAINAATYNSLRVQPGFVEVPVTELMKQGSITISGTKASPAADEFVTVTSDCMDYNTPLVLCTGLTAGSSLQVEIVAIYDCRLTVNGSTGLFPTRNTTDNSVAAINAYQGAVDFIGHMPSTSYFEQSAFMSHIMDALSYAVPSLGALGTLSYAANRLGQQYRGTLEGMANLRV